MRERIKDKNRLEHILNAIDTIQSRTAGFTFDELTADKVFFAGIVYYTMIIGEAAYMLTSEFREQHSDLPWDQIVSMRHHIVHGYYQVDESIVWEVIQNDLEPLRQHITRILSETDWSEWEEK